MTRPDDDDPIAEIDAVLFRASVRVAAVTALAVAAVLVAAALARREARR